jgi:lysozyme
VVQGIDVSNHQRSINWDAVKSDPRSIEFAFIKATESTDFYDPWFSRNWTEAKRVGLVRGAYHFARPSANPDPTPEVYFFLDKIQHETLEPGDIIILDAEDERIPSGQDISAWYLFWLEIATSIVGFKPLIYTGNWYLDSRMAGRDDAFKDYPLWLSNYRRTKPPAPTPWTGYEFWQYTSAGSVQGVSGDCDVNEFSSVVADLPAYGKPQKETPKPEIDLGAIIERLDLLETKLESMRDMLGTTLNDVQIVHAGLEEIRTLVDPPLSKGNLHKAFELLRRPNTPT